MDFSQRKLSKQEWEGIEVPVSVEEKSILKMIQEGYSNYNIKSNNNTTLLSYAKLENSENMEFYIFKQYLQKRLQKIYKKCGIDRDISVSSKVKPKKRDIIRLENVNESIESKKDELYEFTILEMIEKMLQNKNRGKDRWMFYYYTLAHLSQINLKMNIVMGKEVETLLEDLYNEVDYNLILQNAATICEKNEYLIRYADRQLYDHQKRIFRSFSQSSVNSKMILYVAPTGTGKTLTPIGLAEKHKIIFVCAARHVGLALAKSAISAGRKIALAFNCSDADDIRLHFAAAKEFTKNYKTGGIYRVDNSIGDNVEIMISDIQSYLIAMRYMKAFHPVENTILYWDEPTITMDYDSHPYHSQIRANWMENIVPNIVLSSATLPKEEEIGDVMADYRSRFGGEVQSIISTDCNNSIPLITKEGSVAVPHNLPENRSYEDMMACVDRCQKSSSLIRYMDLEQVAHFLHYLNSKEDYIEKESHRLENYFEDISHITTRSLKNYYLSIFSKINPDKWPEIFDHFQSWKFTPYSSNIFITTKDAYTLTHGPSIYLAKDVEKVAKFYLQQSKIPDDVILHIEEKVRKNDKLNAEIHKLETTFENTMAKEAEKDKKMADECRMPPEMKQLRAKIERLQTQIESVSMPERFVPNSPEHLAKWTRNLESEVDVSNAFVPQIPDSDVIKLMQINDVEPMWKLLLLMGIGVFMNHNSVGYVEIMKSLAQEQKLLLLYNG